MNFEAFNRLDQESLHRLLIDVCHCQVWAQRLVALAPFSHLAELLQQADKIWFELGEPEILESMQGHARIGDLRALSDKFSKATQEQGQIAHASAEVIEQLYALNCEYFEKFGFIFLVFATGKSPETLLDLISLRLHNSREQELREAQRQQALISENRLQKLFA